MADFNYEQEVHVGDFILVRDNPGTRDENPAIVFRVKPSSVDALVITRYGFEHRFDLWHEEDERVQANKRTFDAGVFRDRGVFRIDTAHSAMATVAGRVAKLEQDVRALTVRLNRVLKELGQPQT